jgi:hypothetical protein
MLGCIVLANLALVHGAEQTRPLHMTFSYVNHPVIIDELIPLVRQAYASLGIATSYVEQPSDRNLKAISQGLLDGDVVFSELLLKDYEDLVIVAPPLVESVFVLLCQQQLPCNSDTVKDPTKLLVATDASHYGLNSWFGEKLKVDIYHINNLAIIPQLITEKRFEYGIYIFSAQQLAEGKQGDFNFAELFRTNSFHILHPKYAYLKADVSKAITQIITYRKNSKNLPTTPLNETNTHNTDKHYRH